MTIQAVQIQKIQDEAINHPYIKNGVVKWDIRKTLESINCPWLFEFYNKEIEEITLQKESGVLMPYKIETVKYKDNINFNTQYKCEIKQIFVIKNHGYVLTEAHMTHIVDINKTDWIVFEDGKPRIIKINPRCHRLYTDKEYQVLIKPILYYQDIIKSYGDQKDSKFYEIQLDIEKSIQNLKDYSSAINKENFIRNMIKESGLVK